MVDELQALEVDTKFVTNPLGAVHDVAADQLGATLAEKSQDGWRLATAAEIREYCKVNGLEVPDLRTVNTAAPAPAPAPAEAEAVDSSAKK